LTLNQHKLAPYDYAQLPKRWRKYLKQPPLHLVGSNSLSMGHRNVLLFWGMLLLLFSLLVGGPTLYTYWKQGSVQVVVNEELITLGWEQAKLTAAVVGIFLLFPVGGLLLLWQAARVHFTPGIMVWLTKEGLHVYRDKQEHFFPWESFAPEAFEFELGGTARLPLQEEGASVTISRVKSPTDFFQLIDQRISGNKDLVRYHAYKEQLNASNLGMHYFRRLLSGLLYVLKPLTIGLGVLLFAAIPFVFVTVVHLKDDGDMIFRFAEYGAVLVVSVFTLAALISTLKSIYLEYKSRNKGRLWQVLTFLLNVGLLTYGLLFFVFYRWLPSQAFGEAAFFERLFYFFYGIAAFFACFLLFMLIARQLRPYLLPVLALREFGSKGIAGQWSEALSPGDYELKANADVFLHQIGGLFSVKPVYAYYDHRLEPEGLQDGAVEYFLQSEQWLDYVTACAKIAQAIVIVPATSKSLLMEMNMLCEEDLLSKTYVLMPPEKRGSQSIEEQWESIRSTIDKSGYHLPAYAEGGMVYQPNDDFSVRRSWKLHHSMRNLFFIPRLRRWRLSRYSVYDRIYRLDPDAAPKTDKTA
jgi:hypothetical protein